MTLKGIEKAFGKVSDRDLEHLIKSGDVYFFSKILDVNMVELGALAIGINLLTDKSEVEDLKKRVKELEGK